MSDPIPAPTTSVSYIEAAAKALVLKMEAIHADPAFISIFAMAANRHGGGYRGPTYTDEFAELKRALGI